MLYSLFVYLFIHNFFVYYNIEMNFRRTKSFIVQLSYKERKRDRIYWNYYTDIFKSLLIYNSILYIDAFDLKWVNSDYILYAINSLRLRASMYIYTLILIKEYENIYFSYFIMIIIKRINAWLNSCIIKESYLWLKRIYITRFI